MAIDSVLPADAVARAEMLASAENEQGRLARALTILSRAEALRFLGVTSSAAARFTFARGEMECARSRIRARSGGSSQVVQPLIDALRQRLSLRGRLFALINR